MTSKIKYVGKIGSMALIRSQDSDIDYNIFSRVCSELEPGVIWISSGATEIGRLDYINRHGEELKGGNDAVKSDYSAQGQAILMENYRRYISQKYSVRQLLVEHTHFNDDLKKEHIMNFLKRCPSQNAIPIINYNDPVSFDENRKMEISQLKKNGSLTVECIDNDETAAVICNLVNAPTLIILTSVKGIYINVDEPNSLIEEITADSKEELLEKVNEIKQYCIGSSRNGAGGAYAKLQYVLEPALNGTRVLIAHAKYRLSDIEQGKVPCTRIEIV